MSVYQTIFDLGPKPFSNSIPVLYQGSHVIPKKNHRRGGCIDLGAIRVFVTRQGDDSKDDAQEWLPWLRVSVGMETVLLTEAQVQHLHGRLGDWLGNVHHPKPAAKRKARKA